MGTGTRVLMNGFTLYTPRNQVHPPNLGEAHESEQTNNKSRKKDFIRRGHWKERLRDSVTPPTQSLKFGE